MYFIGIVTMILIQLKYTITVAGERSLNNAANLYQVNQRKIFAGNCEISGGKL